MKISLSAAFLALTRDPLSLLNCMMFSQLMIGSWWGACLISFILLGYFSQVLKGAILADQAQLPQARDLSSALRLGCLGTAFLCGCTFISFSALIMCNQSVPDLDHPSLIHFALATVVLWAWGAGWSGLIHTYYLPGFKPNEGNLVVISAVKIFFRPPLSGDGLLLAALFAIAAYSGYHWQSALSPCIPACFLLAHGLGQYLRKALGYELQ